MTFFLLSGFSMFNFFSVFFFFLLENIFNEKLINDKSINNCFSNDSNKNTNILNEDYLELFIEENTIESKNSKYICSFCNIKNLNKKLNYDKIRLHFIESHEIEYNNSIYSYKSNLLSFYNFIIF